MFKFRQLKVLNSLKHSAFYPAPIATEFHIRFSSSNDTLSPRMQEFKKKLREKIPIGKLNQTLVDKHPSEEQEPLVPWPNNTNPNTGEIGGPKGPEPTRYGDWERKGRVTDF